MGLHELLLERVEALEKRVNEIDARTTHLIRLGPGSRPVDTLKDGEMRKVNEIVDAAKKVLGGPTPPPPVDRSARCLLDGSPVPADQSHTKLRPDGMQENYVVLSIEERAKGFVRPVRRTYVHVGKPPEGEEFEYPITKTFPGGCGRRTTMGLALAETYARDPHFYSGTFCVTCGTHFDLDQFVWEGTTEQVGS
jgi:hypothetical protein